METCVAPMVLSMYK